MTENKHHEHRKEALSKDLKDLSEASRLAMKCALHIVRFSIGFGLLSTVMFAWGLSLLSAPTQILTFYDLITTSMLLISFLVTSYGVGTIMLGYIAVIGNASTMLIFYPRETIGYWSSKISHGYMELREIDWRKSWDEDTLVKRKK